jgi:hypothetical protein
LTTEKVAFNDEENADGGMFNGCVLLKAPAMIEKLAEAFCLSQ